LLVVTSTRVSSLKMITRASLIDYVNGNWKIKYSTDVYEARKLESKVE